MKWGDYLKKRRDIFILKGEIIYINEDTDLALIFKGARKGKDFTQQEMAVVSGISQSKISKIESGLLEPTIYDLLSLSWACEIMFVIK